MCLTGLLFGKQLHADAAGGKKADGVFLNKKLIESNLRHTELQLYLDIDTSESVKQ